MMKHVKWGYYLRGLQVSKFGVEASKAIHSLSLSSSLALTVYSTHVRWCS